MATWDWSLTDAGATRAAECDWMSRGHANVLLPYSLICKFLLRHSSIASLSQVLRTKWIVQVAHRIFWNIKRRAVILVQLQIVRDAEREVWVRQIMSPEGNYHT